MIKHILAIGDSYTFGEELSDHVLQSWPRVLADKLNCKYANLAIPGGSNDRIFRIAVEETLTPKYDLVICAWTDVSRLDLVLNGREFPITSASVWHHKQYPWLKEYYANHHDEHHATRTWLAKVIALQEYFKNKNQRYIFVNMQSNWQYKQYYIDLGLTHFVNQIDTVNYPGWTTGEGLTAWQGDCPKGPHGHPLELGHQRIAEKINEHIRNLGWLP